MNSALHTASDPATERRPPLTSGIVAFMAAAAALGTSTVYLLQPAIARVADSLDTRVADVGIALACGPVGYLVGLVAIVPLVDRFRPGRVLGVQFAVLAAVLALGALAGTAPLLGLLVAVTGACSVVGAGLSSMAGRLAAPRRRATTLGVVTSGISAGILGGRIVGGLLADHLGWRGMLLCFAGACALVAACCPLVLPVSARGTSQTGYLAGLRSLPALFVRHEALRLAAVRGALWFFGFCTVWAGLAVALSQPPFAYSPERIGLYALAGLAGVAATQVAGRFTDRVGARAVLLVGLATAAVAVAVCGVALHSTAVTMVCLGLFDAGLFAAQVANQSTVLAIDPAAPARVNSAYMVVYFVGGSSGTAFGAAAVGWFGWQVTTLVTLAAIVAAAVVTLAHRTR